MILKWRVYLRELETTNFCTLVQRNCCKGSWMPECPSSEFGQGPERKVEGGQAISLNYFKEENKELTVMQKQCKKALHMPPKPVLYLGFVLLKSYPIGISLHHLCHT